ncbi:hypothetical protein BACPU_13930 [Bacillus pumilus]|nr:hypothetical protein BACPU_13930 [Bacillus pumilus]
MTSDQILDVTGLACPKPIIRTKKKMNDLAEGQVLEIHATDKGAKADLAAWAKSSGHELITQTDEGHVLKFWVRKGS